MEPTQITTPVAEDRPMSEIRTPLDVLKQSQRERPATHAEFAARTFHWSIGVQATNDVIVVPIQTPVGPRGMVIHVDGPHPPAVRCDDYRVLAAMRTLGEDDVRLILETHDISALQEQAGIGRFCPATPALPAAVLSVRDAATALIWAAHQCRVEQQAGMLTQDEVQEAIKLSEYSNDERSWVDWPNVARLLSGWMQDRKTEPHREKEAQRHAKQWAQTSIQALKTSALANPHLNGRDRSLLNDELDRFIWALINPLNGPIDQLIDDYRRRLSEGHEVCEVHERAKHNGTCPECAKAVGA